MTTPSSLPPANWYPDPQTPGQLRYWDGQRWTQHTHPLQQAAQGAGGYAAQGSVGASQVAAAGPGAVAPGGGLQGLGQQAGGYQPGGFQQGAQSAGGYQQAAQSTGPTTGGVFAPTGVGAAPGAQAAGAQAAGPQAAGPATGGMFMPGGAGGAPGQALGGGFAAGGFGATQPSVGAVIRTPTPREIADDDGGGDANAHPPQALVALVFGVAAIGATLLAIYQLGTPFDDYLAYAGAALGFFGVLFGLMGRKLAADGFARAAVPSWFGIGAGFLGIGLSAYEIMYPGDLAGQLRDLLGG